MRGVTRLQLARIGLLAAFLTTTPGCGSLFHQGVEAVVEFEDDDTLLILPLRERTLGYFQSPLGAEISDVAIEHVEAMAEEEGIQVVPSSRIYALFDDGDPAQLAPYQLAEKIGCDLYAVGQISVFRLRDPGAVNLLHGTLVIDMEIWRRALLEGTPDKRVWVGRVKAQYPSDWGNDYGAAFISEDRIRRNLVILGGRNLARKFFEHDPDPLGGVSQ